MIGHPALLELLGAVLMRSTGKDSRIHGPTHWASVAAAGLSLLDRTGADPLTVLLFSIYHDSMREGDGRDPEHGERAARLAREMREEGDLDLDDERLEVLEEACRYHDKGGTSDDATIGTCWDADRLNLYRVGITPKASLMSTEAGRASIGLPQTKTVPRVTFDWPALFLSFGAKTREDATYVRFGELPEGGYSSIVASLGAGRELGVSVFLAYKRSSGDFWRIDLRALLMGTETRFFRRLLYEGGEGFPASSGARPCFEVSGEHIGMGGLGDPVLAEARIIREVPPEAVCVYPEWPELTEALQWWRLKRAGEDPGPAPPTPSRALPGDRSLFPFAGFGDMVRAQLEQWGLLEDYDRMQAQARARRAPPPPDPLVRIQSANFWNDVSFQRRF